MCGLVLFKEEKGGSFELNSRATKKTQTKRIFYTDMDICKRLPVFRALTADRGEQPRSPDAQLPVPATTNSAVAADTHHESPSPRPPPSPRRSLGTPPLPSVGQGTAGPHHTHVPAGLLLLPGNLFLWHYLFFIFLFFC